MVCRYIPAIDESVIGIITEKYGENFAVDIGGPFIATLPVMAFEGATRRNRPNLQVCRSVLVTRRLLSSMVHLFCASSGQDTSDLCSMCHAKVCKIAL